MPDSKQSRMEGTIFQNTEFKTIHHNWLKAQIVDNDQRLRGSSSSGGGEQSKSKKRPRVLDPSIGALTRPPRIFREVDCVLGEDGFNRLKRPHEIVLSWASKSKHQLPGLVVESVQLEEDYQSLLDLYVNHERGFRRGIENLLLLRWTLQGDKLSCKLEHYQNQASEGHERGSLAHNHTYEIFPEPTTFQASTLSFNKRDIFHFSRSKTNDTYLTFSLDDLRKMVDTAAYTHNIPLARTPQTTPDNNGKPARNQADNDSGYGGSRPSTPATPSPEGLAPSTPMGVAKLVSNIISILNLDAVYPPARLKEIAKIAAKNLGPAIEHLGLSPTRLTAEDLMTVNLFDTYFYLDDSGSMRGGSPKTRFDILKDTVRRLAPINTSVRKGDLYLRYINTPCNPNYDKLNAVTVSSALNDVRPWGGTQLGTQLERQIVEPLKKKLEDKKLKVPIVVIIITDGEPCGEDRDHLKKVISRCKAFLNKPENRKWGHSAIIFQIHYVGDDLAAERYMQELEEECKDILFVNKEPLDRVWDDPKARRGELEAMITKRVNRKLLRMTAGAIKNCMKIEMTEGDDCSSDCSSDDE